MTRKLPIAPSDLRGMAQLAVEAANGVTDIVEAMHHAIGHPEEAGRHRESIRGRGVKGLVYEAIRALTRTVGGGVEVALSPFESLPHGAEESPDRETLLAALNGVVGDHLAETGNPLAIPMGLRWEGRTLDLDGKAFLGGVPQAGPRVLLLVHGLCRSDGHWLREGHDHGAALARDLGCTLLYLRYNSGLHVSTNGKALADLLEALVARWPVPLESLAMLTHSMGGLVARSACRRAEDTGQAWLGALRHLVFLGAPHHGAPLERGGHWLERILGASPFTGPLAGLGKVRSAGITDLRHGNLLEADWQGHDRFEHGHDTRVHVPLPRGVRCYAMAAATGKGLDSLKGRLLGDGLVPVDSALGRHRDPGRCLAFPEDRVWIGHGMGHLDLLHRSEVYERIRRWLQE